MKKYFTANRTAGLVSLLVFTVFVTFGSSLSIARGILFFMLGIIISFASFYIMNLTIPVSLDGSWLALVPFTAIMAFCSLILRWDIYLPFLLCGILSVAVSAASTYIARERSRKLKNSDSDTGEIRFADFSPVLRIFGTALASVLLFLCICGFVEVFI